MTEASSEDVYQGQARWNFELRFWFDVMLLPAAAVAFYAAELRFEPDQALRDPASMLMHLVAIVMLIRGLLRLPSIRGRLHTLAVASRLRLQLTDEELYFTQPGGSRTLARESFFGAVEEGDWRHRKAGARWSFVHLLHCTSPYDWCLSLPPVVGRTPGELAEALMRWKSPDALLPPADTQAPTLPSRQFEAAATGAAPQGSSVISHGSRWILRGPYSSACLGLAILLQTTRSTDELLTSTSSLVFGLVIAFLFLVPLVWLRTAYRHVAPRRGVAILFTPEAALVRTRAGVLSLPWSTVSTVRVESHPAWSILEGQGARRQLRFERPADEPVFIEEAYIKPPLDAVALLAEAYRTNAPGAAGS